MTRFIVTHGTTEGTQDQFIKRARKVVASLAPGMEWLNSWWDSETGKLLCEWEAPDAEAIRASLAPALDLAPIEAIHEVQWIDPQWYKQ